MMFVVLIGLVLLSVAQDVQAGYGRGPADLHFRASALHLRPQQLVLLGVPMKYLEASLDDVEAIA